ncbi:MAG TPA: hypothetical protein VF950_15180 [Planctomycetota bacterium]
MEKQTQKPIKDQVLKEFQPLGKYRIRLLADPARPGAEPTLDIREYVSSQTFEGFTRRGIRLTARADLDALREVLLEVAKA